MRHRSHRRARHSRETSQEGFLSNPIMSNPLNILENPILFENPLDRNTKIEIGIVAAVVLGIGAYFLLRSKTASAAQGGGGSTAIPAGQSAAINPLQPGDNGSVNISAQGGLLKVTLPMNATMPYTGAGSVAVPSTGTTSTANYSISYITSSGSGGSSPGTPAFLTGNNTLTVTWTDPNGAAQVSTISVNVG